ncbi:hypothetical protein QOZ80_3BG0293570 [Eleusine coracana subsp. coracana]|nr:hypothetical protein QOZ80_3BG0293570 [Eleusine coracana subsp. coracana]
MKRFVTKECNYEDVVSRTPLIHISVDFIKSRVVASIPGFFFCIWYAAKKYSLAINDLGISYYIQLVFPTADAAWPSSMFTIGDTVRPGIFVAIALHIAVPRCSKNHFFNCAFFRYTVGLTVIVIITNWFQATQPSLLYAAHGVIGFVAVHFLFNGEVNQIRLKDGINQLMAKVWDWNMYGTELKRFDRWVFHTANEDCDRVDNATALLDDRGDDPKDGSSGSESLEDSDDEIMPLGQCAVQLLAIRANFPICAINGYDGQRGQRIYFLRKGEVQEEGMVDLVPVGPCDVFMAYGVFILEVFYFTTTASDEEGSSSIGPPIKKGWDVCEEETKEYTQTICASPGR